MYALHLMTLTLSTMTILLRPLDLGLGDGALAVLGAVIPLVVSVRQRFRHARCSPSRSSYISVGARALARSG